MCNLFSIFHKEFKIENFQPASSEQITGEELFQIINRELPQSSHIYISDNVKWLCNRSDVDDFLLQDDTNKNKYVAEEFDCDDFSFRLMGQMSVPQWARLAKGIIWTDKHALNCFVDENKELWYIEPQGDVIQVKIEDWQGTEVLFVMM